VSTSVACAAFVMARKSLLTRIFSGIRVAAGALTAICFLMLFVPGAPQMLLIALLVILVSELAIVEGSRVFIHYGYLDRAAIFHIALTHWLVVGVALLLESSSFFAVATVLLLIMAIVLVSRWFAMVVGVSGLAGYILLPALLAHPAIAQMKGAIPVGFHVLLEVFFVSAVIAVTAVLMSLTTQILRSAADQATHLADQREALRLIEAEANQKLTQQIEEQRRLLEVIQTLEAPIVPLRDGVLVVPLVSYLDSRRLAAIEERVLTTVSEHRTRLLLVDLTGVPTIDTAGVHGILRLAEATRLLGLRVALTGIQPVIAQAMAMLEDRLQALTCYATIQDALLKAERDTAVL
jgi:rsbT co-antagonist protein RsbR